MLFFFPRGILGEILNLIESVSGGFPSYFWIDFAVFCFLHVCIICVMSTNFTELPGNMLLKNKIIVHRDTAKVFAQKLRGFPVEESPPQIIDLHIGIHIGIATSVLETGV